MRKGLRKTKQVVAGILSAALLMTSLPQNSTYVYATEQAEELTTDEITQTQNEAEKITDVQTDSTTNKETQLQAEAETNKTDNSENAITEVETTKTQDSEKVETEEETTKTQDGEKTKTEEETTKIQDEEKTETEDLHDKSKSEETNETQASTKENVKENIESDTETQEESSELEETTKSEESEIESEIKELETEYENKTNTQMKIVEGELAGVYQFGDFPVGESEKDKITTYSMNLTADTNLSEIEDYLYRQMKKRNEIIDVQSYQISIEEMGKIVTGVLNENPDLYFVNRSYRFSHYEGDTLTIEVKLTYDNSLNEEAFQKAVEEALLVVKSDMSDFEKAVILHDYLALNCEYDEENYEAGTIPNVSYSAYGVLVNRTAVCQGYALAYKYLLNQLGINCYMVISREMDHGWNLIELNGEYYQVDVTWDDPTCDLIGRVCHKYMFRSDNDFVNECKHHDWSVTKGSEVIDYKAVDTTYDTAFWLECNSPLALVDKECYYVGFNEQKNKGVINKASILDSGQKGIEICEIGEWTVWGKDYGCYTNAYSGLFQANNRLYFNDKTSIYSIALNDVGNKIDKRTEFTANTVNGYIYGSAFCQGKVLYSLRQKPSITSKGEETILTADITIETEKPSKIPVEKIELDKETLKLTVGSTDKLQATVTPDNATDANVTWKSSDDAIATVEDGTVTAIAVGSCTITAIADGKEAVCNVTVNASREDIASGSYKDITWAIDADGKLTVEGTGDYADLKYDYYRAPWSDNRKDITSAEINVTGMTDASNMFYGCSNLTSVDFSNFDTSQVTDMVEMFYGCSNLTSVDFSSFDTSHVTNMSCMFRFCTSLTNLNLSSFDTSHVESMSLMFDNCSRLASLDVSSFNTSQVTGMNCIFNGCNKLTSLDVSSFDTSQVESMEYMFNSCSRLTSLDVSGFDTSKVKNMEGMFCACSGLTSLDVSGFETSQVTNMEGMFFACRGLTSLDVSGFDTSQVTNMNEMFARCNVLTSLDMGNFDISSVTGMDNIFNECSKLLILHTPYNLNLSVALPSGTWYQTDGTQITELPQNLDHSILIKKDEIPIVSAIKVAKTKTNYVCGDTINIDDLTVTYYDVDSIARELEESQYSTNADEIDMSTVGNKTLIIIYNDGGNAITDEIELTVTEKEPENIIASGEYKENGNNITWVIDADGKLTVTGTGDFSDVTVNDRAPWYENRESIITAEINVTGMVNATGMFYNCKNLVSVDLSRFNTGNVTDMYCMFTGCSNLTSLDVSNLDTSHVTDMGCMFQYCSNLTSLDVSNFDTSNVINMWAMFDGCSSLTSLDVSNFDTSRATTGAMFKGCSSLTSLDVSGFDTSQSTRMDHMFDGCSSLISLDVSGFDTSCSTLMRWMFFNCSSLISLDLSKFDTGQVTDMDFVFSGCSALTTVHTPCNLTLSVSLPKESDKAWYDPDGTEITELPQNLNHSIIITKKSTASDDNIASGNYKNITWAIDANGKLTVTGTGEFSDSWGSDRTPWYDNRESIISAEINVTSMVNASYMFCDCSSLTSVDMSGFDTGNITDMESMFYGCSSLTSIDISNFDLSKVEKIQGMIGNCSKLTTIYTPRNLKQSVLLPLNGTETAWYDPNGTEVTELPQNLDYSIKITKNKIPTVSDPYIIVQKIKKTYECGDILNTDDLTVTYYDSDGVSETVTGYTTNANEIDMSVQGTKILTVTYNGLTAEVELTVTSSTTTDPDKENYKVTFDLQGHGTALEEYSTYTAIPKGTTITRPTSPEAEGYQFTGWYKDLDCKTLWDFEKDTIEEDTTLYAGWEITETDPTPDQQNYTVTFNLQGHGTALEEYATYTAIPKGTTITRPTSPEAEGYQFTGWYKDPNCKTLWDFEKDTIDEDTTLYAGWKSNGGSDDDNPPEDIPDGIWIAQIKDYIYTGKPIIPSVVVYFNRKRLTAGQDYTITYKNNTKAALASAAKAPTVVVKGKGNYAGTKKASFTINKIQLTEENNLKAAKVYPIGVKYTPIVTANGNVLKSGTDYKLAFCDAYGNELKKQPTKSGNYQLHITGKGNCEGEIIFSYSVSESGGANAISKGTATIANYIYGNEEPKVTLSVDGKTLTRDTNYLVSFANTHKKGTATATFIGIGNYTGTIKKNFKVQAAAIQSNNITVAKTASYEKGGAKAEVSVTVNGTELVLGTDYTATYKKNTKLGTASVVIKGKGNYTGSQTKEFKVEPKSLKADGVKIYVSDVLTGKKPTITLYDTNGKKLAANSDYKAEIDKAAHKVTISAGKNGLYKTETPITISYQELEKGKQVTSVALNKKSNTLPKYFEYTGKEVVLEKDWLTVKAGKNILKSNEFEILGYVNNTKKGTATVIIKGCNGYGGIKMLNFKIKARGLF